MRRSTYGDPAIGTSQSRDARGPATTWATDTDEARGARGRTATPGTSLASGSRRDDVGRDGQFARGVDLAL